MFRYLIFSLILLVSSSSLVSAGGHDSSLSPLPTINPEYNYTGVDTACAENSTYVYANNNSSYACIIKKSDGRQVIYQDGREVGIYENVESLYYDYNSDKLIASIKKGEKYAMFYDGYVSPYYDSVSLAANDKKGNTALIFYEDGKYGWIYNRQVQPQMTTNYPSAVVIGESHILMLLSSPESSSIYTHAYLNGKAVFTEYTNFVLGGEGKNRNSIEYLLLGQSGKKISVLRIKKDGSTALGITVPGKIAEYGNYFVVNPKNAREYTFSIRQGNMMRIVTQDGLLEKQYDTVESLYYYGNMGLYQQTTNAGKYSFSLKNVSHGPYDSIESMSLSYNNKNWSVYVTRDKKDFMIVNGKEIPL